MNPEPIGPEQTLPLSTIAHRQLILFEKLNTFTQLWLIDQQPCRAESASSYQQFLLATQEPDSF